MRFLMSSRAKRNPFGAVLHGAKGSLLILQRQVQLGLREPKTEPMLAWGASFLLTRHVPSLPCYCRQTASKPCFSAPWAETKRGATQTITKHWAPHKNSASGVATPVADEPP